jgi:hypothetical protein
MADTTIPNGCYVVLDLPDLIGEKILDIRERFSDIPRTHLPAEITVAGSSGNGVMEPGQSREEVFRILDAIAASTSPFIASFGPVKRFPSTDIFVLTLLDKAPFQTLHRRINDSDILFTPNPHPFEPHCTLSQRSPISDDDVASVMEANVSGDFIINRLAVYLADTLPAKLLHRVPLTGGRKS